MARTHDLPRLTHGAILWREVVAHHSVTPVSAGRLNGGDGVQIEIDHLLKRRRGGAVAQAFRQSFEPRGAFELNRDHLGQRIVPALASASPRRLGSFDGERSVVAPAVWRDDGPGVRRCSARRNLRAYGLWAWLFSVT